MDKIYQIQGRVVDRHSQQGVSGLRVEAWDKDLLIDDLLGVETTDDQGRFYIKFNQSYYQEICFDRRPDIYFLIYDDKDKRNLIESTENKILWNVTNPDIEVTLGIGGGFGPGDIQDPPPLTPDQDTLNLMRQRSWFIGGNNTLDELNNDDADLIAPYLNDALRRDIIKIIGPGKPGLENLIHRIDLDYRLLRRAGLKTLITKKILLFAEKEGINKEEISAAKVSLEFVSDTPVGQYLQLDVQPKQHSALSRLINRGTVLELAKLAGVTEHVANQIAEKDLDPEITHPLFIDSVLEVMLEEKVLNRDQVTTLRTGLSLARISKSNISLVETVLGKDIDSLQDLIIWEASDWENVLRNSNVPIPPDESDMKSYAENLRLAIEKEFPVQYTCARLFKPRIPTEQIRAIERLKERNTIIVYGKKFDPERLDWQGVDDAEKDNLTTELTSLFVLNNTYRRMGLAEILNDRKLGLAEKQQAIESRLSILRQFEQDNPNLDLSSFDLLKSTDQLKWAGVTQENRTMVEQQLLSFQRAIKLASDYQARSTLLGAGYDSSFIIARETDDQFTKNSGLPVHIARQIRNQAINTTAGINQFSAALMEQIRELDIKWPVGKVDVNFNDLKEIDGYAEISGQQNYCHCEHCNSVLSPAAYFVDLMIFIEDNVSKKIFLPDNSKHPLYLKNRRPDLWKLGLSCENTSTELPYLQIVNEVLEQYLLTDLDITDVYTELAASSLSINLPFSLSLEEIRHYLGYYKLELANIYRIVGEDVWRQRQEILTLSDNQLSMISKQNQQTVHQRYGNISLAHFPVADFIRITGISRDDLDHLLMIQCLPLLSRVTVERIMLFTDIQSYKEKLKGLDLETLDLMDRFLRLQKHTPWSIRELDLILTGLVNENYLSALGDIDSDGHPAILVLGDAIKLASDLNLKADEMAAIINLIPEISIEDDKESLFERLFDREAILVAKENGDSIIPYLLAGLGINDGEFAILSKLLDLDGNSFIELDQEIISDLYRHARLARALGCSIEDLNGVIKLVLDEQSISRLDQIDQVVEYLNWQSRSPFEVADLLFILRGEESEAIKFKYRDMTAEKIYHDALDGIDEIVMQRYQVLLKDTYQLTSNQIHRLENINLSLTSIEDIIASDSASLSLYRTNPTALVDGRNISQNEVLVSRVYERLAVLFEVNPIKLEENIIGVFVNPPVNIDQDEVRRLLNDLERIYHLIIKLNLDFELLEFITNMPEIISLTSPDRIDTDVIRRITMFYSLGKDFSRIKDQGVNEDQKLHDALKNYQLYGLHRDGYSLDNIKLFIDIVAELKSVPVTLIETLFEGFDDRLSTISSALDVVDYISELTDVCIKLGLSGESLRKLTQHDGQGLTDARTIVVNAFMSRFGDEQVRNEKSASYAEKINSLKRDALCDYITSRNDLYRFSDRDDLYAYFLLDVNMDGCFTASRLTAAISSLQTYINRCQRYLEQSDPVLNPDIIDLEVRPSIIPVGEWEWRKTYRIWEANRKVFLYPENTIVPSLRDNKTFMFRELEEELLQQNITQDSVEDAYKKYLSQFNELTRLRYAGAYCHESSLYYLFARTNTAPYQYYMRTYDDGKGIWGNWEKVVLTIEAEEVSSLIHNGRIYLFWTLVERKDITRIDQGSAQQKGSVFRTYVKYSYRKENGKWSNTQSVYTGHMHFNDNPIYLKVLGYLLNDEDERDKNRDYVFDKLMKQVFRKPYVMINSEDDSLIDITRIWSFSSNNTEKEYISEITVVDGVHLFPDGLTRWVRVVIPTIEYIVINRKFTEISISVYCAMYLNGIYAGIYQGDFKPKDDVSAQFTIGLLTIGNILIPYNLIVKVAVTKDYSNDYVSINKINLANNKDATVAAIDIRENENNYKIITNRDVSFIQYEAQLNYVGHAGVQFCVEDGSERFARRNKRVLQLDNGGALLVIPSYPEDRYIKLTTDYTDEIISTFYGKGLGHFLALDNQYIDEQKDIKLDFDGPYGVYYWELFFHIPSLIADHLNANQKFEEAKWWYERIFNPIADSKETDATETARFWQFREFRDQGYPKLLDIFYGENAQAALELYRNDPFNPHAIARLRHSAYQKTIVMKYIDNLLDWGDYHFARDTREDLHEAVLYYQLASDILGKRPVETGKCRPDDSSEHTYTGLKGVMNWEPEFLPQMENYAYTYRASRFLSGSNIVLADSTTSGTLPANSVGSGAISTKNFRALTNKATATWSWSDNELPKDANTIEKSDKIAAQLDPDLQGLVIIGHFGQEPFCIPTNDSILDYWDRVEDRMYKIHNCMNIKGMRRSLALYQPPIDPMLLVRARAMGLSFDEILDLITPAVSSYRFTYLLEKARQFTQTVQSFGAALLSALEKKDTEEMTLLRSLHERNILELTQGIKVRNLKESTYQYEAMQETLRNIQNRISHYGKLLESGLSHQEITQQISQHTATMQIIEKDVFDKMASLTFLIPQMGSVLAMTFGGREMGQSIREMANSMGNLSSQAQAVASSAGLEASFQRRAQEWGQQLKLAEREYQQVEKQLLAAEIRRHIAEKDVALHQTSMEQAKELDEFYKDKTSNLALQNYLSRTLNRLYREAYNQAYSLAKQAEAAYQFEHNVESFQVKADNWQADRAGLLAGEKLLLQLQAMEKEYIETNERKPEINQSFSISLLDPQALLELKASGTCQFKVPQIVFNILYPGQYRRLIKSVRLTIPCLTGPYVNVAAKLTLMNTWIQEEDSFVEKQQSRAEKNPSITASSAQNDAGMFEFNFRDERYLPFEGVGAISEWRLELPSTLRAFDYDSISDVIIHMAYTAIDGDRNKAEAALKENFVTYGRKGLPLIISMKHEFPDALHTLKNIVSDTHQTARFIVDKKYFPYFVKDEELEAKEVRVYLTKDGVITSPPINAMQIKVKDVPFIQVSPKVDEGIVYGLASMRANPIGEWSIKVDNDLLSFDDYDDILIIINYKIKSH